MVGWFYFCLIMVIKIDINYKVIVENCWVWFDYFIEIDFEVGIVLIGFEVKSLCIGQLNIVESYVLVEDGELWLINGYIVVYKQVGVFGYEECCKCKLLVLCKELVWFWQVIGCEGMMLILLVMYFNDCGKVKLKIGVVKGKKNYDKCEIEVKCDWGCEKQWFLKYG